MFASKQLASRQRVVTATLGWIIAFGIISLASAAIFNVVVCLTALLSFNEFLRMFHINEEIVLYRIAMIAYLLICMAVLGLPLRSLEIGLLVAALIIITTALVTSKDIKQGTEQTAKVFFGVVYVSLFLYLVTLRLMTSGRELILVLSAGTWGRDLAAYF